jgi:hypothetical protein
MYVHKIYAFMQMDGNAKYYIKTRSLPQPRSATRYLTVTPHTLGLVRGLGHPKLDKRDAPADVNASCPDVLLKRG